MNGLFLIDNDSFSTFFFSNHKNSQLITVFIIKFRRKMKEGIKTFKFNFHATLGEFVLNAPSISSPLTATWKRSSESASTSTVEMNGGKANFNQTITLQLNMYYEEANQIFQQKKTLFTFNMQTPKGEKQAGVVYIEVAQMLNNKMQSISNNFVLEKCPVKDSKVSISIVAQLVGETSISDSMSVDSSVLNQSAGPSTLSIESKRLPSNSSKIKEQEKQEKVNNAAPSESNSQLKQKIKIIESLEAQVKKLNKQKEGLAKQLERQKSKNAGSEASILKQQLLKSKNIQQKLQSQINNLRSQNIEHERELQKMRIRMEQIYELLFSNLNSLY